MEISVTDIVSSISLLLAMIGSFFAYFQWRKGVLLKRADYINELIEKIRSDDEIREVIYMIDYGEQWYSREFHLSSELEKKVDKTLSYFSYICYLKKQKIISFTEFAFFEYQIERILNNNQIIDYLYNLYHFSNGFNSAISFKYLFEYGEKKNKFNSDFYDNESYLKNKKYHKNIDF